MDLAEHLGVELSALMQKVGKEGQMDAFTSEYGRLLQKLTAAMKIMKQMAVAQGVWLRMEAAQEKKAGWN